jgi:predicted HTH transcriptional regulator
MAWLVTEKPPGKPGGFLLHDISHFFTPDVQVWKSIKIHQNRLCIQQRIYQLGRITSADVLKATGQKPGTVRNRLNELCELGLLTRHGKARATWYVRGKNPE